MVDENRVGLARLLPKGGKSEILPSGPRARPPALRAYSSRERSDQRRRSLTRPPLTLRSAPSDHRAVRLASTMHAPRSLITAEHWYGACDRSDRAALAMKTGASLRDPVFEQAGRNTPPYAPSESSGHARSTHITKKRGVQTPLPIPTTLTLRRRSTTMRHRSVAAPETSPSQH
jgi:hypothetical protein